MANWASDASEIMTGIAALAAAWTAWRGMSSWKEQKGWDENHKLGREFLRSLQGYRSHYLSCLSKIRVLIESSQQFGIDDAEETLLHGDVLGIRARIEDLRESGREVRSLADELAVYWDDRLETLVDLLTIIEQNLVKFSRDLLPDRGSGFLIRIPSEHTYLDGNPEEKFLEELRRVRGEVRSKMKKPKF